MSDRDFFGQAIQDSWKAIQLTSHYKKIYVTDTDSKSSRVSKHKCKKSSHGKIFYLQINASVAKQTLDTVQSKMIQTESTANTRLVSTTLFIHCSFCIDTQS